MQDAPERMNDTATCGATRTKSVPARSPFDLNNARAYLIAKRNFYGAKSKAGFRCSNIIEQMEELQTATGDQRTALEKSIQEQMADLERLTAAFDAEER